MCVLQERGHWQGRIPKGPVWAGVEGARVGLPAQETQSLIPACLFCRRKLELMSGQVLFHSISFLGLNFFFFSYSTVVWFFMPCTKSFHRCSDAMGTTWLRQTSEHRGWAQQCLFYKNKTKQNRT